MFRAYKDLQDVISAVITCTNEIMLVSDVANELYIPFVKAPTQSSWSQAMTKETNDLFGDVPVNKVLRLNKVYLPDKSPPYAMHCVYHMPINADQKNKSKNTMGKYKGKVKWVNEADLTKLWTTKSLKTPEVYEYFHMAKGSNPPNYVQPDNMIIRGNVLEVCDDIIVTVRNNMYENMVVASDYNKSIQECLLKEFFLTAFPATQLGHSTFLKIVSNFGWSRDDAIHLFRAADMKRRRGVSFREILYMLASLDPKVNLVGPLVEPRSYYVFGYFDKDEDGILNASEFKTFILESRKARKMAVDPSNLQKDLDETYKALGLSIGADVTMNEFVKACKDNRIKGIPVMLKSPMDMQKFISNRSGILSSSPNAPAIDSKVSTVVANTGVSSKDFELAVHTIRINKDSNQINVEQVFSVPESASTNTMRRPLGTEVDRKASIDVFSPNSFSNDVLKALRYLCPLNKKLLNPAKNEKPTYNWGQLDAQSFIRNLTTVANMAKEIFRKEPRLLQLTSPMYVMGDLHGNVFDLLHFEGTLWHLGANLCPCELLFLGDYVDRGPFSIEVIAYLFAYKIQNPHKVHLLRGNHEIRDVQKMFTFYGECLLKCGEKVGADLWNTLNSAFDNMPVAAVIDSKIFCCHGGCPPPWLCPVISAINDIPVTLNQPNQQSSLAWEIMWNDPVKPKQMNDKLSMELMANEGFAVNARRGTAHVFSAEALDRFLKANKLTHLIRAHEVVQAGYYIQQKGKMVTIFSSSKYCGGENEAACVLVDQAKLRILRLAKNG